MTRIDHLALTQPSHQFDSVELLRRMGTDDEYGPTLPTQWACPRSTELVVCEYEDLSGSRQVGTCEYLGVDALGGTSRVNSARFIYRVFEGRTGALVTRTWSPGSGRWSRTTGRDRRVGGGINGRPGRWSSLACAE